MSKLIDALIRAGYSVYVEARPGDVSVTLTDPEGDDFYGYGTDVDSAVVYALGAALAAVWEGL